MRVKIIGTVWSLWIVVIKRDGAAADLHRSIFDVALFRGLPIGRVIVGIENFERIARLQVALKVHFIREHVDHLHDDFGGDSGLHRRKIER